jgi:hypothetical protein
VLPTRTRMLESEDQKPAGTVPKQARGTRTLLGTLKEALEK